MLELVDGLVELDDGLRVVEQDQGWQGQDAELSRQTLVSVRVGGDEVEIGEQSSKAVETRCGLGGKWTPRSIKHNH